MNLINGIKVKEKLVTINYTKGMFIKPKYIVVHGISKTNIRTPMQFREYIANDKSAKMSTHYVVGENHIIKMLEDDWRGWHVGDKPSKIVTNSNSISIAFIIRETCDEEAVLNNTIGLVRELKEQYGIKDKNVLRHYDVTGKLCPKELLDEEKWQQFLMKSSGVKIDGRPIAKGKIVGLLTKLNLKERPIMSAKTIGHVLKDSEFLIFEELDQWCKILTEIDENYVAGYLSKSYVEIIDSEYDIDEVENVEIENKSEVVIEDEIEPSGSSEYMFDLENEEDIKEFDQSGYDSSISSAAEYVKESIEYDEEEFQDKSEFKYDNDLIDFDKEESDFFGNGISKKEDKYEEVEDEDINEGYSEKDHVYNQIAKQVYMDEQNTVDDDIFKANFEIIKSDKNEKHNNWLEDNLNNFNIKDKEESLEEHYKRAKGLNPQPYKIPTSEEEYGQVDKKEEKKIYKEEKLNKTSLIEKSKKVNVQTKNERVQRNSGFINKEVKQEVKKSQPQKKLIRQTINRDGIIENTDANLEVRRGPGEEHFVVSYILNGEKIYALDRIGDWVQIRFSVNGRSREGFVRTKYVKVFQRR